MAAFGHFFRVPINVLLPNLPVDFLLVIAVKWRFTIEHDVNNNTCAPNVNFGIVFLLVDDLRRHVERTSENLFEFLVFGKVLREAEVSQLNLQVVPIDAIN